MEDIDELDDIQIYGRAPRVRVKNNPGGFQEVTITVHWLKEVDTPAFKKFLKEAVESAVTEHQKKPLNIADLTPWKVLGKKWHLSRKGFPSGKTVKWETALIDELEAVMKKAAPEVEFDWGNQQVVHLRRNGAEEPWASFYTKRRGGIDLELTAPAGKFALGRISDFGAEREISRAKGGREQIQIRLVKLTHVRNPDFKNFLAEHYEATSLADVTS
ncbi:MAG: hypothetical protein U0903_12815 [Planctomycetales bacterium]